MCDRMSLHLYFKEEGRGMERGLEPLCSWCWKIQGVITSLMLKHVNYGIGASFQLDLNNTGTCNFIHIRNNPFVMTTRKEESEN
jgi:hypothetical protein